MLPDDLQVAMRAFQHAIEVRDHEAAAGLLDEGYALVLVHPAPVTVPRDRWLAMLPDYVVRAYEVESTSTAVDGDVASTLQRVVMKATVLGEERSGTWASYSVRRLCRLLGVSPSGFYAWKVRKPSKRAIADEKLSGDIKSIHARSRQTYGVPRVHAELAADGRKVGRKRIARLMRVLGLEGACRRRKHRTTVRGSDARPAPDLVQRRFVTTRPDELWVADITYVPTWTGFLYLAVVLDAWSRRIVGWAMATHLRTELVLDALEMAVHQRQPRDVVHHSDQGCQYTSIAFGLRCREAGIRPSMGSVGDAYDNAMCESFFATLECELLERRRFKNQAEARMAVFDFVEGWYNPHRRHSALDYESPVGYERKWA